MVNHEKNKSDQEILIDQIEAFAEYLEVEKNYALNTISSYKRDLLKFLSFLNGRSISEWSEIDSDVLNIFVMDLRHGNASGNQPIWRWLDCSDALVKPRCCIWTHVC